MSQVFRKVALDRLSSPEQLDQLMKVTSPKAWITLITVGVVIILILIWSIFGSIPIKIEGQGILVRSGGVFNIQHVSGGIIEDIKVRVGDDIEEGTIIARVNQIDIVNQINDAKLRFEELESEQARSNGYRNADTDLQKRYLSEQEYNLITSTKSDKERLAFLEKRLKSLESLLLEGAITKDTLYQAKAEYESLKSKIAESDNRIKYINIQKIQYMKTSDQEKTTLDVNIEETKRKIASLEQKLNFYSNVVSSYTGKVLEIMAYKGMIINPGTPLISIELTGRGIKNIEAIIYVPSHLGKNIKVGMEAFISPGTAEKEEYGYIIGRVNYVAEFPASPQGMYNLLGNDNLINSLTAGGPVLEVDLDLVPYSKTFSGYKWTSKKGAPIQILTGTLCSGMVIQKSERPITLIIPTIRKKLGI